MELDENTLKKVEEMSAALLPPFEIAILVDIAPEERNLFVQVCKAHKSSKVYAAYQKGKLTTKLELRKTVIKLAKAGSPAAEPLAEKYIREQQISE
ncbi:MAG: hypothetical protein LBC40_05935 [Dysgonamonadaceae bacterium]|jgi:hypothetical protein|nr:hypothetical protein [Dysgonamonadaceae bacterium]